MALTWELFTRRRVPEWVPLLANRTGDLATRLHVLLEGRCRSWIWSRPKGEAAAGEAC